jgi:tRNA(fMet)-specific endonuclease VapC
MGASSPEKMNDIKLLTNNIEVLSLSEKVARKAAEIYHQLRQSNQMIEFRDIFIGATCIVNDLPIKTLNGKHFSRINGLKII